MYGTWLQHKDTGMRDQKLHERVSKFAVQIHSVIQSKLSNLSAA